MTLETPGNARQQVTAFICPTLVRYQEGSRFLRGDTRPEQGAD